VEIIDYGCGQGIGVIAYYDYLLQRYNIENIASVKRITLIDQSESLLKRASLNINILFPKAEIHTVFKKIDDLSVKDLIRDNATAKLHIFSDILDIDSFLLEPLAEIIKMRFFGFHSVNQFVCVSPYLGQENSVSRLDVFKSFFNADQNYSENVEEGKWKENWGYSIRVFQSRQEVHKQDQQHSEVLSQSGEQDAKTHYSLGVMYEFGDGVEQDEEEAIKNYHEAANKGYKMAQFNLGLMYLYGESVKQDDVEAAKWFRKAAEQGEVGAQYTLGWMYDQGRGVPQDDAEAIKWYKLAADQGDEGAKNSLTEIYNRVYSVDQKIDKGKLVSEKNRKLDQRPEDEQKLQQSIIDQDENVEFYREAAENGESQALSKLKAMCDEGNPHAQFHLALMYEEGAGVPLDLAKALDLYRRAAEQNLPEAQFHLGLMYGLGNGIQKDDREALNWFLEAAKHNLADAQFFWPVCMDRVKVS